MGKSKQKKGRKARENPTGVPTVRETEEDGELGVSDSMCSNIASLVEKLQSISTEERECACNTIANLIPQPRAIPLLLQHDVVRVMSPLMVDKSMTVRETAVGALRNMSVDGGYEICQKMISQDTLTPLFALMKEYGSEWKPSGAKPDKLTDVFVQAVHLLWNLCESGEVAVKRFNMEGILPVLWMCLNVDTYSYKVALPVAQCLNTVSEDNPEITAQLQNESALLKLEAILDNEQDTVEGLLFRTLAAGILFNLSQAQLSLAAGSVVERVVDVLTKTIEVDANEMMKKLVEKWNQVKSMDSSGEGEQPSKNGHLQTEFTDLGNVLAAQQLAVEIITNLCCSEDDCEEWEDLDSSSTSSEELFSGSEDNTPMEEGDTESILSPLCVPSEVHGAFVSHDLLPKILNKIPFPPAEVCEVLDQHKQGRKIRKSIQILQSRALLCVNNMVSGMAGQALGGLDRLHAIWLDLSKLTVNQLAIDNLELLEGVTSAMRAVIQKLAELESKEFYDVTPQDLHFLFEMGQQCSAAQVRGNTVRVVCTIGCILAKLPTPHSLLKNIGLFLVEVATKDMELWVVAEALDAIFDVFAEDHIDPVVKEIGLVGKLRSLSPMLKSKIHQQKKTLGEHLPIIMTARTNLIRFIKYKSQAR